jgi:chitin disaccharide deacetylase
MELSNAGRGARASEKSIYVGKVGMTYIIINADDFGYSDGICKAILELLDAGAITSTSIMCAAIGAEERLRSWQVSKLLGVAGVHLQLTSGKPLSPVDEVSTLIDQRTGWFRDPRTGQLPDTNEVELEWRCQIEAARAVLGGPPTHLDSHHGLHRIPEFFEIYVKLASELNIPVRGAGGKLGKRMRSEGIQGTVALVREWTGKSLGPKALRQMVNVVIKEYPEEEVVEVICHPGYNDEYLTANSKLSAAREDDYRGLLQLVREGWPEDDGHILTSHSHLTKNR